MKILTILAVILSFAYFSKMANANIVREINALDFGVFTNVDSGTHSVVVTPNGATTMPDGGIYKLKPGRNAVYRLTDLDPNFMFYVTIDPTTLTHVSGSPVLTVDTFTFDPPNDMNTMIHTDPDATLIIKVGATLHIPGGTVLNRGAYRGTYNFMINY